MERDDIDAVIERRCRPLLDQVAPRVWSARPIQATDVQEFCGAVEDGNPVYWDQDVAASSRFGRLIAPPHALMALNTEAWWLPPHRRQEREEELARSPETEIRATLAACGLGTVTVVEREEEYLRPFGPGDGHMGRDVTITGLSRVKGTKVGRGVFLTRQIEYVTEASDGLPVARARHVVLIYTPNKEGTA